MPLGSIWAQQTAAPSPAESAYTVGNGVSVPKPVHVVHAVYPPDPALAGIKRSCTVDVLIGVDGVPAEVKAESAHPDPFDEAAIAAIKLSTFKPGRLNGRAVPVLVQMWVPFLPHGRRALPELLPAEFDQPPLPSSPPTPVEVPELRNPRYQVTAIVSVIVDVQGLPSHLAVVRSAGKELDEKALEVISRYRFRPATKYGLPIPASTFVEIDFKLK